MRRKVLVALGVLTITLLGTTVATFGQTKEVIDARTIIRESVNAHDIGIIYVEEAQEEKKEDKSKVINNVNYTSDSSEVTMISEVVRQRPELESIANKFAIINETEMLKAEFSNNKSYNNLTKPQVLDNGLVRIRCTVYTDQEHKTASGQTVRKGVLAGKKEWIGKTCILYSIEKDENGNETIGRQLGIYEFLDTGKGISSTDGTGSIRNGDSIDMWHATEAEAWGWVKSNGNYVYMQFIENAVG